jgi:hypothetical protein
MVAAEIFSLAATGVYFARADGRARGIKLVSAGEKMPERFFGVWRLMFSDDVMKVYHRNYTNWGTK